MKKIVIYASMIALLVSAGCSDFLDIKPVGAKAESDFLTPEGIRQVMTGMYARLNNTNSFNGTLSNYAYGDVMGGDANKGSNFADQPDFTNIELYSFTTNNGYFNTKWGSCYDGVFRANVLINMCDKIKDQLTSISGVSKDYYTETIAQARFIRAFWHFEVIKLFGAAVPYVSDADYAASVNPQISNVDGSGNFIYIWDKVAEDFQFAYDNLPNTWPTKEKGRANKWAAAAFLAKVKLYQSSPYNGTNGGSNKWAEVKSLLETIMANGVDNNGTKFRLAGTYEELYVAGKSDWTGESVFDIQMTISSTQTNTNTINGSPHIGMSGALGNSGWGFYQPSYEYVNAHIVNANGLPYTDKSYRNMPALTTASEKGANIPKTDLAVYTDPRLDISTGRFQVPYWDWAIPTSIDGWIRELNNGGYYLNKKNIPKKADKGSLSVTTSATSTAKNFHLLRYADVLLWYAEALIETGDYQGARQYINQVRARAGNGYVKAADPSTMAATTSPYVLDNKILGTTQPNAAANYRIGLWPESQFASKEGATAALRWERRIEMGMEGHRWYDLARWNIVADEITEYINYEKQYLTKFDKSAYNSEWVTMPIPYSEILTMDGVLVQNPNWVQQ